MTRTQLIAKVARQTGHRAAEVESILDTIVDDITDCLSKDEKVTISGFGRFEMRQRNTKSYTNPKTKAHSILEPRAIPGWKPSGLLKDRVQKGK